MTIERVIVRNYRTLHNADLPLGADTNIIVGDNESGKSTLLEAINLALKCQLSRRPAVYELHPFLFNSKTVADFIASHKSGKPKPPPEILIELYLKGFRILPCFMIPAGIRNLDRARGDAVKCDSISHKVAIPGKVLH